MKRTFNGLIISILILLLFEIGHSQLTGRDIMLKVDVQQNYVTQYAKTKMTLINKKGKKRVRDVARYEKTYPDKSELDKKSLIFFEYPPDVRGTGLLLLTYTDIDKDDDRWLYLPALKKIRRIAGESKNDYFMGTDFTYDDMGSRDVDEDTHKLIGEEDIDGQKCFKIESIPKDKDYMYSRKIAWVIPDKWVMLKVEFYDRHGELLKILKASDIRNIDNIWTTFKLHMNNLTKNHQTVIDIMELDYSMDMEDAIFTQTTLQRGRVK